MRSTGVVGGGRRAASLGRSPRLLIRVVFILAFVAAIVAAVVLVFSRPVTRLAKIHIVLTVLVGVAFVAGMRMASWLHSMAYADPVRQVWQPRLDVISNITWFGTVIPWFLFTIFHVIVVLKRKTTSRVDL